MAVIDEKRKRILNKLSEQTRIIVKSAYKCV